MVNCNPETVSTDSDTSDRLYFEPLDDRGRARGRRARAAGRRRRPVRRPDAAQAGAPARATPASRSSARRSTPSTSPRTASASAALLARARAPRAGLGDRRDARRGGRDRRPDRLPGARAALLRARRPRDARLLPTDEVRAALPRARPRCSSTGSSRTRSRSTSTRSATATTRRRRRDGARRGGGRPLGRLDLRAPAALARTGAASRRSAPIVGGSRRALGVVGLINVQFAVAGRRRLRARGQPARVAHGAVRVQGDRASTSSTPPAASPPARGSPTRRCRRERPPTHAEREGGGAAVRALPRRRPDARPGDALDRRGHGDRADFPTAFARPSARPAGRCRARGARVPLGARRGQAGASPMRAALAGLGFDLVATAGTARAAAARRHRRRDGAQGGRGTARPTVVDLIRGGRFELVINTPQGSRRAHDGYEIREAALAAPRPCITTIAGAAAAVQCDRPGARRGSRWRSRSGIECEPRTRVASPAVEPVGALHAAPARARRARPRRPGPVLHARAARAACCRARCRLAWRRRASSPSCSTRRPGHAGAVRARAAATGRSPRPARPRLPASTSSGRSSSAAASASRRCRTSSEALGAPPGRARLPHASARGGGRAGAATRRSSSSRRSSPS